MRFFLLALASVVVGCSSNDSSSTTSGGSGSDPVTLPSVTADLSMSVIANAGAERLVMGTFLDGYDSGTSCSKETVAGCTLSVCTKTDSAKPGTPIDPGAIKASSPSIGTDIAVPLTAGYARLVQPGTFTDGEEVRVVGAGSATVAAFDLKVKVPGSYTVSKLGGCAPGAAGTKCDLSDAAPVLEWTGAAGAVLVVSLQESVDVTPRTSLSCGFDASKGNGKIPADALAKLPRKYPYVVSFSARGTPAAGTGTGKTTGVGATRTGSGSLTVTLPGG